MSSHDLALFVAGMIVGPIALALVSVLAFVIYATFVPHPLGELAYPEPNQSGAGGGDPLCARQAAEIDIAHRERNTR